MSDQKQEKNGPTRTEHGPQCRTRDSRCKWLNTYDFHYHYCGALPDSSPALRPGGGSRIFTDIHPDCPYAAEVENAD